MLFNKCCSRAHELMLRFTAFETPTLSRDVRTRRCCSGHLRKLRKILKCRRRHGSKSPIGPRPRRYGHASAPTDDLRLKSGSSSSHSRSRRARLRRPRLESPARRRNSSAEWPGPSIVMSALARAHQPALQQTVQSLHGSHLHNRLNRQVEIQRYRRLKAELCSQLHKKLNSRICMACCEPATTPAVYFLQPAADSLKVSRQVLAHVPSLSTPRWGLVKRRNPVTEERL